MICLRLSGGSLGASTACIIIIFNPVAFSVLKTIVRYFLAAGVMDDRAMAIRELCSWVKSTTYTLLVSKGFFLGGMQG